MNEITYQNKVALNENSEIADINKVKASDMNEIKSVVNTNSQTSSNNFGLGTDTWTSSGTYAIGDIVVYNDNTYKNLTGTNTSTTPDQDSTNWQVIPLIVNEQSNSTKNAYSCDYVNKALVETYSTNEVKTNKVWIDGKPIYKKTFYYNGTMDNSLSINYGISNFGTFITYEGSVGIGAVVNQQRPIPCFYGPNFNEFYIMLYDIDKSSGKITINMSDWFKNNAKSIYITLYYTKTTD